MHNSSLTLQEKIGQLFFIGIPGEEFDSETKELIQTVNPGGICLFARNTKNAVRIRTLLEEVRKALPLEPFLSIDQEGGLVDRLRRVSEPLPSAGDISTGTPDDARALARITADIIRTLGLNMNFAPVVDFNDNNSSSTVMKTQKRVFGNTKDDIVQYAGAYLDELQSRGIMGCLKHFPGIGSVVEDPHDGLPSIEKDFDEYASSDLFPFKQLFAENSVHGVMSGHVVFPNFDIQETDSNGKMLPSSLSKAFVSDLLRKKLGFKELALTDDLEMGAIVSTYGIGEAAVLSVEAGNDFVLICNQPQSVIEGYKAVSDAVASGRISEERLECSLSNISKARELLKNPLDFSESYLAELSMETRELKNKLA